MYVICMYKYATMTRIILYNQNALIQKMTAVKNLTCRSTFCLHFNGLVWNQNSKLQKEKVLQIFVWGKIISTTFQMDLFNVYFHPFLSNEF